jgi:branched-chain amino acid transport system ATP-binding protein
MTALLDIAGLTAGYGKKTVVQDVALTLQTGDIVVVLGHNGAGKTTLLRAVFGLIRASSGRVSFDGHDITGRGPSANIADGLALVPQGHGIFRTLNVRRNLELGGFSIIGRDLIADRMERVFRLFPVLRERQAQIGGTLSGGQQQMLAIGMALMPAPRLLILDEPSIGLAPLLVEHVMESVREINENYGTTILMVEQNPRIALKIASRAVVLNRGSKVYDGAPEVLTDERKLL